MNWQEVALGEICEFRYGKSLPTTSRAPGAVRVYGSNGQVGSHSSSISNGPTIVIGRKGSFGEVHMAADSCWPIDTTYYVDRTATNADLTWLYYRLRALGLTRLNRAAAVPGLNRDDAYRQRVLLPPPSEQRRIAAFLDHAEGLLRLRSASIRQTDALKRSIFAAALNRCVVKQQRVSELFKTSSGSFLPAKRMKAGDVPVYGGNGVNGYHDTSNVPAGTIVIGRVGANCGAVHRTIRPAWVTDNALIVKPLKEMNPIYLEAAIAGAKLNSRASQSGQPAISYRAIEDVNLPIISIAEQNRYADQYSAIDIQSGALRDSERTLNALFASLQSRAFRGEL